MACASFRHSIVQGGPQGVARRDQGGCRKIKASLHRPQAEGFRLGQGNVMTQVDGGGATGPRLVAV